MEAPAHPGHNLHAVTVASEKRQLRNRCRRGVALRIELAALQNNLQGQAGCHNLKYHLLHLRHQGCTASLPSLSEPSPGAAAPKPLLQPPAAQQQDCFRCAKSPRATLQNIKALMALSWPLQVPSLLGHCDLMLP